MLNRINLSDETQNKYNNQNEEYAPISDDDVPPEDQHWSFVIDSEIQELIDSNFAGGGTLDLTAEELHEILNKFFEIRRENGSKLQFHGFKTKGNDLSEGIEVSFNENHTNHKQYKYPTTFKFTPFTVSFKIGDDDVVWNNKILRQLLVNKLTEKYPDVYPRLYAYAAVKERHELYLQFHDLEKSSYRLLEDLALINKDTIYAEDLVKNGPQNFDYDDLLDLNIENE